jgi:hypothetical protein
LVVFHLYNHSFLFGFLGTVIVFVAGLIFLLLNNKFGYISASFAHLGADLGICIAGYFTIYNIF